MLAIRSAQRPASSSALRTWSHEAAKASASSRVAGQRFHMVGLAVQSPRDENPVKDRHGNGSPDPQRRHRIDFFLARAAPRQHRNLANLAGNNARQASNGLPGVPQFWGQPDRDYPSTQGSGSNDLPGTIQAARREGSSVPRSASDQREMCRVWCAKWAARSPRQRDQSCPPGASCHEGSSPALASAVATPRQASR